MQKCYVQIVSLIWRKIKSLSNFSVVVDGFYVAVAIQPNPVF